MKQTLAVTFILACVAAVSPLHGQAPDGTSSLGEAKRQFLQAEERAGAVIRDSAVDDFLDSSDEDRQSLRDKLRPVLEESFDARQRLQRAELAALRRRLTEIEQAIAARETSKAAIVSARLDSLLLSMNGTQETIQYVQGGEIKTKTIRVPASGQLPNSGSAGNVFYPATSPTAPSGGRYPPGNQQSLEVAEVSPKEQNRTGSDVQFDIETREQLAQIDLQEAREECDAAEKQLQLARQLHESARGSYSEVAARENDLRRAKAELDRAKVKLEGLARQRESVAKAAVADAEGQWNMAVGIVRAKEGNHDGATARLQKAEASLQAAAAKRDYELKQYQRLQELVASKVVDANVVEEHKAKLASAEAAAAEATSDLKVAKAYFNDTARQLAEARAAVPVAEAKLREAEAEHDRLRRPAANPSADADPKPVKETQQ